MKKTLSLSLLIFCIIIVKSQPIITNADMPQPGDIVNYNIADDLGTYNYVSTGNNFIWDFSFLTPVDFSTDTFIDVNSTALLYAITFNNASVALKKTGTVNQNGIALSDLCFFYKNSSSSFSLLGYGAKLNGITIPAKYDNPDILYKFPLNVDNIDSSNSFYELNFPNIGYYAQNKKRINYVDGWGTLYLPADTFQVIRVKSEVYTYDTVYSDSLGISMGFNNFETEYKWITNGHQKPVLEIIKSNVSTTATYYGNLNNSINEKQINDFYFSIFPNPAIDKISVCISNAKSNIILLSIYSILGKKIFEEEIFIHNHNKILKKEVYLNSNSIYKGIYIVGIHDANKTYYKKIIIK